jgi:hypothetical protein
MNEWYSMRTQPDSLRCKTLGYYKLYSQTGPPVRVVLKTEMPACLQRAVTSQTHWRKHPRCALQHKPMVKTDTITAKPGNWSSSVGRERRGALTRR